MIPAVALKEFSRGIPCSKYVKSTCCSPIYRRVRLSEDGSYQDMYCDCGHCMTCCDRKRNEMAARMFLHSTYYDYCYFVTLTYGSYNLLPCKSHPFLAEWLRTIPTYDTHNQFHAPRWSPTILVKSHLQNFLKRLRKLVGEFTYCACGEYGEDYGRPHFHVILFSNVPITQTDCINAWSYECKRTSDPLYVRPWRGDTPKTDTNGYYRFSIGRVDFHDLYKNGSLNYDGKHPGDSSAGLKAMNNFTYVAKYLGKSATDLMSNLPSWVHDRIRFAWSCYTNNLDTLSELCPCPQKYQLKIKKLVFDNYEHELFESVSLPDFKKIVKPFFLSSRRPAIGKRYYLENRKRFQAKEFVKPTFMGKSIQFPSYYFRLLALDKYPIRLRKNVASGVSLSKDLLPRVYAYFSALREDSNFWFYVRNLGQNPNIPEHYRELQRNGIYLYSLTGNPSDGEVDHIDFVTPGQSVIHFVYNPTFETFTGYVYNRHTRKYDLYEHEYDREEFCDMVLNEIEDEYADFPEKLRKMEIAFDLQNAILSDDDANKSREEYIKLRLDHQLKYKSSKTFKL